MLTRPLHRYLTCSRLNKDPSESFHKPGQIILNLDNSMDKSSALILPAIVLAKANDCKSEVEVGDVVYVNPMSCFQTLIEGRLLMTIHEEYCLQRLPREEAEKLGITAVDCRPAMDHHKETGGVVPASQAEAVAMVKGLNGGRRVISDSR